MVKKGVARGVVKKYERVVLDGSLSNLTLPQKEVLYYLIDERLTAYQIANIRSTSHQAITKIIRKLKEKGVIKEVARASYFKGGCYPVQHLSSDKEFRLHAQCFTIEIQEHSLFYQKILKSSNRDTIDNNSIMLYADKIIIYANKDFWGSSVNQCVRMSLDYWSGFITKLENHYKIWLIKGQRLRLREFRGEIAKVGDPIARKVNASEDKFSVYDNNGIRRVIVDKSFKFDELEAVSSEHYVDDMKLIERRYRDWIENDTLMLDSEIQRLLQHQMKLSTQILEMMTIEKELNHKREITLREEIDNLRKR